MNYKLTLAYDGSRYDGWQRQGNTSKTIQGKLEALLTRLEGRAVEVHGAGRTDAGVHARGQVCSFHLSQDWDEEELRDIMNGYLPGDIAVLAVEKVPERFHARLRAKGKTYCYRIDTGQVSNIFERNYMYRHEKELSAERMRQAAAYLTGTHDFKSFCSNRHMKKSTIRTLMSIDIETLENEIQIIYHGRGFLYNMVRILTGTLIEAGEGSRTPESMKEVLESRDRQQAGFTAPARGLILCSVDYESDYARMNDNYSV